MGGAEKYIYICELCSCGALNLWLFPCISERVSDSCLVSACISVELFQNAGVIAMTISTFVIDKMERDDSLLITVMTQDSRDPVRKLWRDDIFANSVIQFLVPLLHIC